MALAIGKKDVMNATIDSTMYPKSAPIAESAAELANLCKPTVLPS